MIGERLLDLRKEYGLTQDELAEKLSINKHSISSYERNINEPSDDIKIQIAKFFNISIDYLLGVTDSPVAKENTNYIRIPKELPSEAKDEIINFIDYLSYKYKSKK